MFFACASRAVQQLAPSLKAVVGAASSIDRLLGRAIEEEKAMPTIFMGPWYSEFYADSSSARLAVPDTIEGPSLH